MGNTLPIGNIYYSFIYNLYIHICEEMNKFLLVLTFNKSLRDWSKEGMLDRELKYYSKLSKANNLKISILSYGDKNDEQYLKNYRELNIITMFQNKKINNALYIFLLSIIHILKNIKIYKEFLIIKTNQNYGSWIGSFIKLINPKCYFISRGGYDLYHFQKLEKKIIKSFLAYFICLTTYKLADKILVPTLFYENFVNQVYKIKKEKIFILPNYIDTDLFKPIKIKKFPKKILTIGRLINQKNLFNLISLISKTGYSLDILGSGPLKSDLVSFSKLNECHVRFLKPVSNINLFKTYNKYKYFILFSHYEGNPKVLLEAMSCELCCFINSSVGINNIISNFNNGIIADHQINKNLLMLETNPEIINKISINARKSIEKKYSLARVLKIETSLYENIEKFNFRIN